MLLVFVCIYDEACFLLSSISNIKRLELSNIRYTLASYVHFIKSICGNTIKQKDYEISSSLWKKKCTKFNLDSLIISGVIHLISWREKKHRERESTENDDKMKKASKRREYKQIQLFHFQLQLHLYTKSH